MFRASAPHNEVQRQIFGSLVDSIIRLSLRESMLHIFFPAVFPWSLLSITHMKSLGFVQGS